MWIVRRREVFLKCYLLKHVVGYSLSVCEFVSVTEKSEAVTEVAVNQSEIRSELPLHFFVFLVQCFSVLQGSRSSQMKMSNVCFLVNATW